VAKASCTTCHDPHGADQPALLLKNVHAPVANRMCSQCHESPESPTPFATKRDGFELCKGCHNDAVTAIMARSRLHWPVADRKGCINCHNPHASKQPKLLAEAQPALCASCHADTTGRIAALKVKHAPVESGACTTCHSPHGASGVALVEQASPNELCTTCHDYSTHSAHPIGDKAIDPRNKNLRVDCLSCHKPHGTDFTHMLLTETTLELCTQCHAKFGR
jgi:predicted CXXCH cytochrome family protein